jgi:hypothetical protein
MEIPNIPLLLDAAAAKRIKSWPHPNNRASEAGHPCVRFLVLSRTDQDKKVLHDVGLQRIFDEGNIQEDAVMRSLAEAGLRVVEQQRPFEWPKFKLTGRIDGIIAVNGSYIPLEIKSCSPNVFPAIKETAPEEMIHSRYPWVRKYPAQILLYMLMSGQGAGVMLFKNKTNGETCQKEFHLTAANLEYAEFVLKKLEAVNAHVAAGTIPPLERCDDCKGCGFAKTVCFPGQDYGPGIDLLTDPELEVKLERRAEVKPARDEYEALDKEVKDQLQGRSAVIGNWIIESKVCQRKAYDVPAEVKKPYETITEYFRTTIERL